MSGGIKIFFVALLVLLEAELNAQDWKQLSGDDLFALARKTAFAGKQEEASVMLNQVLEQNPDYDEARIFKARILAWDERYDEARKELKLILDKSPSHEEALSTISDVEVWDKRYEQALVYVNKGLEGAPNAEDFLYKKSLCLSELKRSDEASAPLAKLLAINPSHVKGIQLLNDLKQTSLKNTIGLTYAADLFSETYDPAHYTSLQWTRSNKWGISALKLNHTNRFNTYGWQPEIELYPKITNGAYLYLNYGYSESNLFPQHRIGVEFYSRIPKRVEASAGIRYLSFNSDNKVTLYTGSIGFYVNNCWLSFRPFIVPLERQLAFSGTLALRKYFKDANNYIGIFGGAGYSSDDTRLQSSSGLSPDGIYELQAQRVGVAWQKTLPDYFIILINAGATRQELAFDQDSFMWITNLSVSLKKRF